jgi:N-formylglutamate deformylase
MHPASLLLLKRVRLEAARPRLKEGTISNMSPMIHHVSGNTALVLDSPHSGTRYPADFLFSCDAQDLRRAEDTHVEKLYDFAPGMGVHWVEAHFPRSYLDANRNTTEIDETLLDAPWSDAIELDAKAMSKVRLGKGLIWRTTDDGLPIYNRQLSVAEVQARIAKCWQPYHAAVQSAIDAAQAQHGYSIHINCHSMPAIASSHATDFPGEAHADFVVGDRDCTTAKRAVSALICDYLRGLGYSVAYNHPYKGVELVRRYSNPKQERHSIQLEINRKLYMNEHTLEMTSGFAPLKTHLQSLVELLLATDPRKF